VAHTSHTSDFVLYRQKSGIGHEETNGGGGVSGDKGSSVARLRRFAFRGGGSYLLTMQWRNSGRIRQQLC
jgi:hypothetical protein